jgi:natural product precursor
MKMKKFEKMKLNKITVANLITQEMRLVRGGAGADSCDTQTLDACGNTIGCHFDLTPGSCEVNNSFTPNCQN